MVIFSKVNVQFDFFCFLCIIMVKFIRGLNFMKEGHSYYSLVNERIVELKEQLKIVKQNIIDNNNKRNREDKNRLLQSYQLEKEFIEQKIHILEKLEDLPLYVIVHNLSEEQLRFVRTKLNKNDCTLEEIRFYLMNKLGLQSIPSIIRRAEMPILSDVEDYEVIARLISIQKRNGNFEQKKEDLTRMVEIPEELCYPENYKIAEKGGKTKPLYYHELEYLKRRIIAYEKKLNQTIIEISSDYRAEVLEEVSFYRDNFDTIESLSLEFIDFHMEKVISKFPEEKNRMHQLLKIATRDSKDSLFGIKENSRKRKERIFLNCVLSYYKNNDVFTPLGIESENVLDLSELDFNRLMHIVEKEDEKRRSKLGELRVNIDIAEKSISETTENYDVLQEEQKKKFTELLEKHVGELSVPVINWIWGVSNLKTIFMNAHVDYEIQNLIYKLTKPFEQYGNEEWISNLVYTLSQRSNK